MMVKKTMRVVGSLYCYKQLREKALQFIDRTHNVGKKFVILLNKTAIVYFHENPQNSKVFSP